MVELLLYLKYAEVQLLKDFLYKVKPPYPHLIPYRASYAMRTFAVRPNKNLANAMLTKNYLKKYNLDQFIPRVNVPRRAKDVVKNYYLKNEKNNQLLIFQLNKNTKVKYSDIEKHLGIPAKSLTEASQSMIEDIIGVKEEGLWTTSTHLPRVNNVTIYKDKSLMDYKPQDYEVYSSLNPWKTKPHTQMLDMLSNPSIK